MSHYYPLPVGGKTNEPEHDANVMLAGEMLESMMSGATLKQIYNIPDDMLEAVYAHAYSLYQKGNMADAGHVFHFLCMHDMYNVKYLYGLASVHQQKKEHEKAAQLYTLCYMLDESNYQSLFYAGQCNLAIKNLSQAKACFNALVDSNAPSSLKKQGQAFLAALVKVKD